MLILNVQFLLKMRIHFHESKEIHLHGHSSYITSYYRKYLGTLFLDLLSLPASSAEVCSCCSGYILLIQPMYLLHIRANISLQISGSTFSVLLTVCSINSLFVTSFQKIQIAAPKQLKWQNM